MLKLQLTPAGRAALQAQPYTEGQFAVLLVRMRSGLAGLVVELSAPDFLRLQDYCENEYYIEECFQARAILHQAGLIA